MTEPEIKQALTRTWVPFFSRFGRLTEVQTATIPLVLGGRNVVVISPSASGKTEAVVAPVVERLVPDRKQRFSVLYVSPTRALVNDLYRRLADPMQYLGLELARKTGDHPTVNEKRLPFMLITTPESFDSLLCRHPRVFKQVSVVVLDELHLLDNSPRGDQLRVLLERLRLIKSDLSYHALSATIEDEAMGERYFPQPAVVRVNETRDIEYVLLPEKKGFADRVYAECEKRRARKVLFFFNARSYVETYRRVLDRPPFAGRVWAHHASLTRQERETVERLMTTEPRGVLCATSTLELGIDIGDIDAVVLFRPPFSISSLLQRIGRGCRRRSESLFTVGIYTSDWERLLFEVTLECARNGQLYEKRYNPCLSVLPQQTFSYLFQRRRIGTTWNSLERVLSPVCPKPDQRRRMFQHLVETGDVVAARPGIYHVSSQLELETSRGKIHSNIQEKSFGDYEVIDAETGSSVGRVYFVFHQFVLAGRTWEVLEQRDKEKRVMVRSIGGTEATARVFEGTGTVGHFYRFARQLKARLFPELTENEFPFFARDGRVHLYHLLGELYGGLMAEAMGLGGVEVRDSEGRIFIWSERVRRLASGDPWFPIPSANAFRTVIREILPALEDRLGSGAFYRMLPEDLQVEDHFQALDISGLIQFLRGLRVKEIALDRLRPEFYTESQ